MSVSFGIAGTGWVSEQYLKWIAHHPQGKVAGIFGGDPDRARARLRGLQLDGKVYASFRDMAADPDVDAIVLCSRPDSRHEQAILAAELGKHLIIEKPVAMDRANLARMGETIGKQGIVTTVSFVLRWNPLLEIAKSLTGSGAIGDVIMAGVDYWHAIPSDSWSASRRQGGSSLLSAGCHAADALRYLAGEVEEVTAYSHRGPNSGYEYDPNVLAVAKLRNGGMGKISSLLECATPYKFNIQLHGTNGTLLNNRLFSSIFPGQTDYAEIPTVLPDSGEVAHHPFQAEIDEFIHAVMHRSGTRCDFADAARSMEVCYAIDESAATGRTIKIIA
ncbi:MAG: Gfo/Idh/MocA family oxidoreductase [Paenibacillaceae bacterium]|nr:Gfo/Idh/MocA family oxidoreductase [Paenibacillaceae bacterium]